jgi:NADH-quinone oxidoreductase subunit N
LLRLGAPEGIVVLTALIVLGLGLATARPAWSRLITTLVATIGIAGAIFSITLLPRNATAFNDMLVVTPLFSLFQIICLVLAFSAIALAHSDRSLPHYAEYVAIVLCASVGMMLLIGSGEFLTIFIGLELLGLSLYLMTAFQKSEIRSAEAGMKYFLFGSTASAFTLFGISLVYGMCGSTTLAGIAEKLDPAHVSPLLATGLVMTLIGFAFKIAAAPFHLWAPDAYQGGPISSAAFIASGSKVASFVVLGKIVLGGFAPIHGSAAWHAMVAGWAPVLAVLAAMSILLGNFVALAQTNVRRLLAYSAVAHAGYTLLGLIAGGRDGFSAALFYTTVYAFTLVGAFAVCGYVRQITGGDDLRHFAGLWRNRSSRFGPAVAAASMTIFLLSLAGLPPLPGFFGKFYLFSVTFGSGSNHALLWLIALALFGSLVSLYYYLIVLKAILLDPSPDEATGPASRPAFSETIIIGAVAALVLLLGIAPSLLLARIAAALG